MGYCGQYTPGSLRQLLSLFGRKVMLATEDRGSKMAAKIDGVKTMCVCMGEG